MPAISDLATTVGIRPACDALNVPRASYHLWLQQPTQPAQPAARPRPARALSPGEEQTVLDYLHAERFQDRSPAAIYAMLLDEGHYHCSTRTMYRLLKSHSRP